MMKVSVTGGKGGTGKSTIAVNLAIALSKRADLVLADLDVEAPNDHILLGKRLEGKEEVYVMVPFFDYQKCTRCGICANICNEGAIMLTQEKLPMLVPVLCSGCKACEYACPDDAILEGKRLVGHTYLTRVDGFELVTGMMLEGEERGFPLVLAALKRARALNKELLLVDTGAGTSNTVSAALDGSNLIIAVTEPTPLGASDLSLILELSKIMGIEAWVVINRWGIGPEDYVMEVVKRFGVKKVFRVPFSKEVAESYVNSRPIPPKSDAGKEVLRLAESLLEEMVRWK